ncbi:hypothetical protein SteCoe_2227 [Stentor coeruleus]|uniref:Mnd1 HTH domain-containing protein n=1 Tax=Stentor coeruleus TaxID=5963 RepID=A0A1R2D034_9CILI|nr:hypothetical protein SteCoe_2227 [Stentor coeruleus]
MGKKGVTFDEKRERMLKIFYDKKEVFNLKELETLGGKAGVISMSVKEVVQSLLDDNMVEQDKIGAGNFMWALPSKGRQIRMKKLDELKNSIQEIKTQKKTLTQQINNQLKDKPESSERLEKMQELRSLISQIQEGQKRKEVLKSCSKGFYDECCLKYTGLRDSINQITDNIFMAKSFLLSRNPGLSSSEINKHFNIPEDLDNI